MEKTEKPIKIKEIVAFNCAMPENVQAITMALARAGRFVNITGGSSGLIVHIYERA